jgi:hypothetical protein
MITIASLNISQVKRFPLRAERIGLKHPGKHDGIPHLSWF